ncbi:flagellar filament capping protein FliD [Rubrivirga sp. IMCC43871]|uniref:flagellar filament capping protein FliD n=1 Tax=Rubrivirga sp. IMCC43871 TaxID=3391575 RepID=UPI00398FF3D8
MPSVSTIANSGSAYEQLIASVIAVESQPRLKLRSQQTDQTVYKAILSDFSSKVSSLDTVLDRLTDPFQSPFAGKSATVGSGGGFKATAADGASPGRHQVQVTQLAQADARLSRRVDDAGTALADKFIDPGDPGDPGGPFGVPPPTPPTPDAFGERTFTVQIAQPDGADPVDLVVRYTPAEGDTDGGIVTGLSAAINAAASEAKADGRLAEGTGVAATVVSETDGTSRLSLRSAATGYDNRLTFSDPDGILAELQVDRTAVRSGTGGGAVYAVGTSAEDSGLSATLEIDGLQITRGSNTIDDALAGITFSLTAVSEGPVSLDVGSDAKGIRSEVDAFVSAYNKLIGFVRSKSAIDPEAGTRGVFASDSAVRGLQSGLRGDVARQVPGDGDVRSLADLGITAERDGTLKVDAAKLTAAIEASPDAVGALFSGDDGIAARLAARTEGLTGASGTIAQRKETADGRIKRLDDQIKRFDARLTRREDSLRAQFALLQEISTRAQGQQASIAGLFYY